MSGDADPAALGRVLRCCASLGILAPVPDGGWELTAAGHALTSGGPMRAAVLSAAGEPGWLSMLHLDDAVRSGRPVYTDYAGESRYDRLGSHPEEGRIFQQFMTSRSAAAGRMAAELDYDGAQVIADIGGGHGTILAAILTAHPHLRGLLLDRRDVLPGAQAHLGARRLGSDRYSLIAGDYLSPSVIPPADAYILGNILHNHDDEEAGKILANLRAASPGARIILAEIILPDDPRVPDMGTDLDMRRLAMGGKERTRSEWDTLLGTAGLDITLTLPTASPVAIIEARPGSSPAPGPRKSHPAGSR